MVRYNDRGARVWIYDHDGLDWEPYENDMAVADLLHHTTQGEHIVHVSASGAATYIYRGTAQPWPENQVLRIHGKDWELAPFLVTSRLRSAEG